MDLRSGPSEFGRWTVGTAQLHLRPTSRMVSPWIAGGLGSASAREPDHESTAANRRSFRFSGGGVHSAFGIDVRLARYVFTTPSLSIKKSLGQSEVQGCTYNFQNGQTTCSSWSPESHAFKTFELRIAIGARY